MVPPSIQRPLQLPSPAGDANTEDGTLASNHVEGEDLRSLVSAPVAALALVGTSTPARGPVHTPRPTQGLRRRYDRIGSSRAPFPGALLARRRADCLSVGGTVKCGGTAVPVSPCRARSPSSGPIGEP